MSILSSRLRLIFLASISQLDEFWVISSYPLMKHYNYRKNRCFSLFETDFYLSLTYNKNYLRSGRAVKKCFLWLSNCRSVNCFDSLR